MERCCPRQPLSKIISCAEDGEGCFAALSLPGQTRDPETCREAARLTARWPLRVRAVGKPARAVSTRVGRVHSGDQSNTVEGGGEGMPEDMPVRHQRETTLQGFFEWNGGLVGHFRASPNRHSGLVPPPCGNCQGGPVACVSPWRAHRFRSANMPVGLGS